MYTEINGRFVRNMQSHRNYQQHYFTHLSQQQIMPEHHQVYAYLPSTALETKACLKNLKSECLLQYYSGTSRRDQPPTFSPSSSSSCSSASSEENSCYQGQSSLFPTNKKNEQTTIGVNLRVTGQCSQGGRKYMEDYFSVAYQQSEYANDLEYAFIGIYDGHGGGEAAKYAKEHLMMEIIKQRLFWSDNDHDVLRAIREGYIATHYAMWREQDKWPKTTNGLPSTAGTTATVAFIRREKIYIGHVGDSGIVLGYQNENENFWRAKQLTTDHKPESIAERNRIINCGGKVVVKCGVPRVVWNRPRSANHSGPTRKRTLIDEIPFLAVARSLGDLWSYNPEHNEFVVSPDPDVEVIPINPNTFRCLIFGTDGLWNVVTAQEAVNTVRDKEVINDSLLAQRNNSSKEGGNQLTNPSRSLVDQALRCWSDKKMRADNTSVVTVILYPPGQVHYNTSTLCKETTKPNSPSPPLEAISRNLEYNHQAQAEDLAYDNPAICKEMASKYLPPEVYGNSDYHTDASDTEYNGSESNEEGGCEIALMAEATTEEDMQQNTESHPNFTSNNCEWEQKSSHAKEDEGHASLNNWSWGHNNSKSYTNDSKVEEEESEEAVEEENGVEVEETKDKKEEELSAINYQSFLHMEAEDTNNATDSYINTFTESMLTTSQDECVTLSPTSSSSSSNSSTNFQSVTPPNMHAILQEQQLYQQQCMSEEEGYSLTKLETRREQLICQDRSDASNLLNDTLVDVQTFKIFDQSQRQLLPQDSQQVELYDPDAEPCYSQQQEFVPQIVEKPLELHSLLQQELEEEQQVAYERLQMEIKSQHDQPQNISVYAGLKTPNNISTPLEEAFAELEYLQDHATVEQKEIIQAEQSLLEQDESVQINEISSSFSEVLTSETNSSEEVLSQESIIDKIDKILILPANFSESTSTDDSEETNNKALTKCNEYPQISIPKIIYHPPKMQTEPAPSTPALTQIKSSLSLSRRAKSNYIYNNVPNPNLQKIISNSRCDHNRYSLTDTTRNCLRSICMAASVTLTPAGASTPILQRQLRSNRAICPNTASTTTIIDYGKRALRSRNSLSKDMKAKSALVQAALNKYPSNTVKRNFLRKKASNLLVGKPILMNELNVAPCNRRSLSTANSVHTTNCNSIKTRCQKTSMAINGSLNQSKTNIPNSPFTHLNLRSRQITPLPSSIIPPPTTNISSLRSAPATCTPVIKRSSLTERRILRSMHTRSTSFKTSQTSANFSKSTKSQSTGSNLAAPPPSPKLINAVAAATAATRARSLLHAKRTTAENGTQTVELAVFGKRSSLRLNGVTPSSTSPPPTSPSTHQTLSGRIVKKLKR